MNHRNDSISMSWKKTPQTPAWIRAIELFPYRTSGDVAKAPQYGLNSNNTHVHLCSKGLQIR